MEHDKTNWVLITKENYLELQPGDSVKSFAPGKETKIHELKDSEILCGQFTCSNGTKFIILHNGIYVYRKPVNKFKKIYRLASVETERVNHSQRILFTEEVQSQQYTGYQFVDEKEFDSEEDALEFVASPEGIDWQHGDFVIIPIYTFKK